MSKRPHEKKTSVSLNGTQVFETESRMSTTTVVNKTSATSQTMTESASVSSAKSLKYKRKLGPGQRVSRACLHCRQRKSRCDLDSSGSPGTPPCQRCIRDGRDCVLGTSNRGGRRIRKSVANAFAADKTVTSSQKATDSESTLHTIPRADSGSFSTSHTYADTTIYVSPPIAAESTVQGIDTVGAHEGDDSDSSDSEIEPGVPANPSDAWQCLTGIAKHNEKVNIASDDGVYPATTGPLNGVHGMRDSAKPFVSGGIRAYKLVKNGSLDVTTVFELISRYKEHFHPYLPLVPRKYFDRQELDTFASTEKHLLTAVLTIASKDLPNTPHIHELCSGYMHELISGIAAGVDCDVEAVEALLLLAEWEPQGLRPKVERVGRGEEDRAAWMHVGLALRSGYFLGLDRTSFRGDPAAETEVNARKRLAWTSCYISDRLISVRIGRAFWSRGPGPMTGLVSKDFPSLQPLKDGDEDYAKIIQATLDLTQLYGNVHDVLYSGMRTSSNMMLMGDYIKYVDDFREAISRWNRVWGTLACSPRIKVTLQMSYEYLRLYTNAFAFQAAISQALVRKPGGDAHTQRDHLRVAFSNVASMSDARFIYGSVDAAKAYLTILVSYVDPEQHLHFMPLRYYLYSIYAAVFLYKARSFGVLTPTEEPGVRELVRRTTERLRRASAGPDDMGSRYARLLELLWKPKQTPTAPSPQSSRISNDVSMSTSQPTFENPFLNFSPANDFSWLDLPAVGDFVSGDQIPGAGPVTFDALQSSGVFVTGTDAQTPQAWQSYLAGDMANSLLF